MASQRSAARITRARPNDRRQKKCNAGAVTQLGRQGCERVCFDDLQRVHQFDCRKHMLIDSVTMDGCIAPDLASPIHARHGKQTLPSAIVIEPLDRDTPRSVLNFGGLRIGPTRFKPSRGILFFEAGRPLRFAAGGGPCAPSWTLPLCKIVLPTVTIRRLNSVRIFFVVGHSSFSYFYIGAHRESRLMSRASGHRDGISRTARSVITSARISITRRAPIASSRQRA